MRGDPNFDDGLGSGDVLPPGLVDGALGALASADDDALYELLPIDPPSLASSTNVTVGFLPLRGGLVVTGSASARQVTVAPLRAMRSSTSVGTPRAMLSAVSPAAAVMAQPSVAGGGLWGFDLLYARISYVDASNPIKGTTCTLLWASPGAYLSTAGAPGMPTLPANTSTTWNVPIALVKNVAGATTCPQAYVVVVPAGVLSTNNLGDLRHRLGAPVARRAYSSANNAPATLVSGGASAFASASNLLSSTQTPAVAGRQGLDFEIREILLPPEVTGGSSNAVTHVVVDDTRDWRNGNFVTFWGVATGSDRFGEDDPGLGASVTVHPTQFDGGASGGALAEFQSHGQSYVAHNPGGSFSSFSGGSALWAANLGFDVSNAPINGVSQPFATSVVFGLSVDASTGALKFTRKRSGTSNGPAVHITLLAFFARSRG